MGNRRKLTVKVSPRRDGGCDVVWRENGKLVGAIPLRSEAAGEALKELLERGVPPIDAVSRAFRKRRPKIGEKDAATAAYGRLGAASRNKNLTPERRKEIAARAALARWGTAKADKAEAVALAEGVTR